MESVFVVIFASFLVFAGALPYNGDLRLMGSSDPDTGRVEIYLDGVWGTIDAGTLLLDQEGPAQTVCRQLGYDNSYRYGTVSSFGIDPANNTVPMKIQNVACPYNILPGSARQHILRCNYAKGPAIPDHSRDFAVECTSNDLSIFPYDTQVRLVQGDTGYSSSGFVEIYLWGSWGPVCNMKKNDADTACRQLGYTEAQDYGTSDVYDSTRPDKVESFHCHASQSCIRNCIDYDITSICSGFYSYINCTFIVDNDDQYGSGDQTVCSLGSIIALAIGVAIAMLVFIILVIIACACICCCCIPGCILHSTTRRKVVYESI